MEIKMSQSEKLYIKTCPVCEKQHAYILTVDRTYFLKIMATGDFNNKVILKKYTRIFVCPEKNIKFQASFTLSQSSHEKIKSVIINGICKEHENATP